MFEKFHSKNTVDVNTLTQKPLILDQSNRFKSFAHINQKEIDSFKKFAKTTWGRLASCDFNKRIFFRSGPKAIALKTIIKYLPPLTNWKIEIRKNRKA
jgi:hypothetical protein